MNSQPWSGNPNQEENRLHMHANTPFYLAHYPTSWEFIKAGKTGRWLPKFSEIREAAGINGVRQTPHGTDSKHARVSYSDHGYTILDYRQFDYLSRFRCTNGYFYVCKWSTPKQIGKKVFWNVDKNKYNDWRESLIEDGILDPPAEEIIDLCISQYKNRITRNLKNQHIPEIKKKIDEWDEDLKKMESAKKALMKRLENA